MDGSFNVMDSDTLTQRWEEKVLAAAFGIRKRVLEHTVKHNGGYLSQACSSSIILATLYLKLMNLGPSAGNPIPPKFESVPRPGSPKNYSGGVYNGLPAPDKDRFFLSPAHYALVLYAALIEAGRLAPEALDDFNKDGGTVEMIGAEHSPGFEMMGGALAQTLSQAAGIAMARKRRGDSGYHWVFLSDGEFQEGQTWEAIQTMSHYKIDNLTALVDVNCQQCDGKMCDVMNVDPLEHRIEAFGGVVAVVDGHDPVAIVKAANTSHMGKPLFVLCKTDPAFSMPILEGRRPKLHYVRFVSQAERDIFAEFLSSYSLQKMSEEKPL